MSEHAPLAFKNCQAYGCPLDGTSTRSTSGSQEWFCGIHFSAEPDHWQAISVELNRLSWLAKIARTTREKQYDYRVNDWIPPLNKECMLGQRKDLQYQHPESLNSWLGRIEGVLMDSAKAACAPAQRPLTPPQGEQHDEHQ